MKVTETEWAFIGLLAAIGLMPAVAMVEVKLVDWLVAGLRKFKVRTAKSRVES